MAAIKPPAVNHPAVKHAKQLLAEEKAKKNANALIKANDVALDWISNHVLASIWLFDIALIVPLLVIPAPDSVKITLGVISGSWIQWWALPALQRSGNKTQAQNEAKAEVDHKALTYVATLQDTQLAILKEQSEILNLLKRKAGGKK